ncbi:MAG: NAD(P)/FAD-dependent oxidoreductase [Sphaerochaetaceae bacterium]
MVVVGGGPAGLAAACSAYQNGAKKVLILERDLELGGILNQCIHHGFGLHYFKEELTGPEYAERFIERVSQLPIEVKLNTMVIEITQNRTVKCMSSAEGYQEYQAGSIILCMGCREKARGAIGLPGDRPAGILSAGTAQRYVNIDGYMVGKKVLILGTGDIGLIMARRMVLEGATVLGILARGSYPKGLRRNVVQCLEDFNIPLYLSHTITNIIGKHRVEKVVVNKTDENKQPIAGTEIIFDCDTVLLSVGLVPENELTREANIQIDRRTSGATVYENMETSVPGVFAAGNVVHVHDLVDFVTAEGERAGAAAARFALGSTIKDEVLQIKNGKRVSYTVPQKIRLSNLEKGVDVFFRVNDIYENVGIEVTSNQKPLCTFKREFLTPGEMERIRIPKMFLEKATSDMIEINIVDRMG